MKVIALATMAALAGVVAQAGETVPTAELSATVCREGNADFGVKSAQAMASEMFAAIGVTIDWREGSGDCPPQGILITLVPQTPAGLRPDAFASAVPFENHIRVFYDRVAEHRPKLLVPHLLAHVLVHEITHVLQPTPRHSTEGVMKARWTKDDISSMMWGPMPFTSEDINLIRLGLAARAGRSLEGVEPANPPPPIRQAGCRRVHAPLADLILRAGFI